MLVKKTVDLANEHPARVLGPLMITNHLPIEGKKMEYQFPEALAILSRTPVVLRSLLQDLPAVWTHKNEGPDTWSPFDVVGHLIHGEETDWLARANIILEHGESKPFEPFDRFAHLEKSKGKSLDELLQRFAQLRQQNIAALKPLAATPDKLGLRGTHPNLGTVTLGELLATWVVHDLNHLGQIVRVMAKQYANAVGPWRAYLGILNK